MPLLVIIEDRLKLLHFLVQWELVHVNALINIVDALSRNLATRGCATLGAPYQFVFDLSKEEYLFVATSRCFLNSGSSMEEVPILLI